MNNVVDLNDPKPIYMPEEAPESRLRAIWRKLLKPALVCLINTILAAFLIIGMTVCIFAAFVFYATN